VAQNDKKGKDCNGIPLLSLRGALLVKGDEAISEIATHLSGARNDKESKVLRMTKGKGSQWS
jgi:hypothetical protein